MKKESLDLVLVARGLAEDREQARRLIMAGEVLVNQQVYDKPGQRIPVDAPIRLRPTLPYVSRGGLKLAAALAAFPLDVTGLVAVDVGASTGGFTDCLLQHGAAQVYAIDVSYGELAWKLRIDPRVVVLERTNIRHLEQLPSGALADIAVIDASFISLGLVLPATLRLLRPISQVIALIKPQFEAAKEQVGKGGVVRDPAVHQQVIYEIATLAASLGLGVQGVITSPAPGPAGNLEFLIWLQRPPGATINLDAAIAAALDQQS
jgi:23S rRNA (cytidine1920-2'-O)/16S rRNA (cytidine1409-2'-O)-methyltransferase